MIRGDFHAYQYLICHTEQIQNPSTLLSAMSKVVNQHKLENNSPQLITNIKKFPNW